MQDHDRQYFNLRTRERKMKEEGEIKFEI